MRTAVNFERAAASREISEDFERLLLVTTSRLCLERGVAFLGRSMNDSRLTVLGNKPATAFRQSNVLLLCLISSVECGGRKAV